MVYEKKSVLPAPKNSSNRVLKQQEKVHTPLLSVPIRSRNSDIYQLHKYIGNQMVWESIVGKGTDHHSASNSPTHSLMTLQRVKHKQASELDEEDETIELDEEWQLKKYKNLNIYIPENYDQEQRDLFKKHKKDICTYIDEVQVAVNKARNLVENLMFVHVHPVDGYMRALRENFDENNKTFKDSKRVNRQAGYWIESYATKLVTIKKPEGLEVIPQASRNGTRPDIIIKSTGESSKDIVWLDITSEDQYDHVFRDKRSKPNEDSDEVKGWRNHYTKEIFYEKLPQNFTNDKQIPKKDEKLDGLIEASKKLQKENEEKEDLKVAKYSESLFEISKLINNNVGYTITTNELDSDPDIAGMDNPNNLYFLVTQRFFKYLSGQENITRSEIGSFVLAWSNMIERYKDRQKKQMSLAVSTFTNYLGLRKSGGSGSDGYIYVNDWLNVKNEIEDPKIWIDWLNSNLEEIIEEGLKKSGVIPNDTTDDIDDIDQSHDEFSQNSQMQEEDLNYGKNEELFTKYGQLLRFASFKIKEAVGYKLDDEFIDDLGKFESKLTQIAYIDLGDPTKKGNLYFQTSKRFFEYLSGQTGINQFSIASFVLVWNKIVESYNRIKNKNRGALSAKYLGVHHDTFTTGENKGGKAEYGYGYVDSWLNVEKIPEISEVSEKIEEFVNDEFEKLKKNNFEFEEEEDDDNNSSGYVENNSEDSLGESDGHSDEES